MTRKAFTLIELVVVIAIIAILAAILFPVFAQAKAAAKKTAALSNIKQLGIANLMYQNDFDGMYSFGGGEDWWGPNTGNWILNTQPYIKNYGLLVDTSDPKTKAAWDTWMKGDAWSEGLFLPTSFASNGAMKWASSLNSWAVYGVMGLAQGSWIQQYAAVDTGVSKPAETIML